MGDYAIEVLGIETCKEFFDTTQGDDFLGWGSVVCGFNYDDYSINILSKS
jgi:hypothetical protein